MILPKLFLFKRLYVILTLFFVLSFSYSQSAGIIINEASNGPTSSQEWVELLVVGDPLNPTANVDLTGWIFDDNNGDFEGGTGVGTAAGHLIFGSAFNSIPPGSLIIVYNDDIAPDDQRDPLIPADDPIDAIVPDGVYILPANHSSFNVCEDEPSSADPSYTCIDPIVVASTLTDVWRLNLAFSNGGDVAQVREPDGSFFHGFSYGTTGAPFPNFPISANPSFNVGAGGTGTTFYFGCGDWEDSVNFTRTNVVADRTPGTANTTENQIFIDKITAGTYDYSNLANSANCTAAPTTVITNRNITYRVNN